MSDKQYIGEATSDGLSTLMIMAIIVMEAAFGTELSTWCALTVFLAFVGRQLYELSKPPTSKKQ